MTAAGTLARSSREKMMRAIALLSASVEKIEPFDGYREYTAEELEPYDALCDRFVRSVEVALKFFRSCERVMFGEFSETIRDLLGRMEKLGLVSSVRLWMEMRDVRNRIVHDYVPERREQLYALLTNEFYEEVKRTEMASRALEIPE